MTVMTVMTVMVASPPLLAAVPRRPVLHPSTCGVDEEPHQQAAILRRKTLPLGQFAIAAALGVYLAWVIARPGRA
jgi:hypothetical protein